VKAASVIIYLVQKSCWGINIHTVILSPGKLYLICARKKKKKKQQLSKKKFKKALATGSALKHQVLNYTREEISCRVEDTTGE